mgnify:CR=1 FL=1
MDIVEIKKQASDIYQNMDHRTGGRLDILRKTFQSFSENRASRAAAGMTYYTLFSLFPLLIVLVTVVSFFVDTEAAINQINQVMTTAIPVSRDLVQRNIHRVVDLRNSIGFVGLIGFIWSASNAFNMLADNVNQAFPSTEVRSFLKKRLVAFGILGTIIVFLVLLLFSSTLMGILTRLELPFLGNIEFFESKFWSWINALSPWFFSLILFISLYRWVPNTDVHWLAALWSAVAVTFAWRVTSIVFSWYLSSGLSSYELIYGSLSAIVILLLWIYISSLIIFFGAHLCAAINQFVQGNRKTQPDKNLPE